MADPIRQSRAGRARRRAVRAQAERAGVRYTEAARQLAAGRALAPGEVSARHGRTVYPPGTDVHRAALLAARQRRPVGLRVADTRRAADLPLGRAEHLTERFPPTRGEPGSAAGPLYAGVHRCAALAAAYLVVAHRCPQLVPPAGDLVWEAEMGEQSAVDTVCAALDRAARRVLEQPPAVLRRLTDAAVAAVADHPRWALRAAAARLAAAAPWDALSVAGAGQVLDAVLVDADDGHAPATRVRFLPPAGPAGVGTVVALTWGPSGPPVGYRVRPHGGGAVVTAQPDDLAVLPA